MKKLIVEMDAFNKAFEKYIEKSKILYGPGVISCGKASCEFTSSTLSPEHPVDEFDRLTACGYRLDLLTGEYYMPTSPKAPSASASAQSSP